MRVTVVSVGLLRSLVLVAAACTLLALSPPLSADDGLDFLLDETWEERADAQDRDAGDAAATEERVVPLARDDAGTVATAPRRPSRVMEEIVVTAQRREQALGDVPLSVQAFSGAQLEARGVLDLSKVPQISPGVTITEQVSFISTYIRGVGSDAFLLADPSVAYYVDGVYYPFASGAIQDFGAVERLEVLKGPQGTLFGRNAIGGAISVITRSPTPEATELSLQGIYGRFDRPKLRLHGNLPLGESFAISASGFLNSAQNHIDGRTRVNVLNPEGEPLPRERDDGIRLKARWLPSEWLDAEVGVSHVEQRGTGSQYAPNVEPSLFGQLLGIEPQDGRSGKVNEDVFYDRQQTTYQGAVNLALGRVDVKLLGSHQETANVGNYDFDGSPQPIANFTVEPIFADVQTAELQLLSTPDSWGAERFEWVAGVYYFRSEQGIAPGFLQLLGLNLDEGLAAGIELPETATDTLRDLAAGFALPSGVVEFTGLIDTDSLAYFGQATATVTDWFSLTVGGRYQRERRLLAESSSGLRNTDGGRVDLLSFSGRDDPRFRDTTRSFDPRVSLDFRPPSGWLGDTPLLYVSWQTATKSSTFNAINITNEPDFVRPEEITAWEIGLRTSFLQGAMNFNAATFYYDIDDLQVQFISIFEGGAVTLENAANARIIGVDFDTLLQPLPQRLPGLSVTMGAAYLDAVYTSFPDGSGFDPDTGLLTQNNDFSGNRVVRTPRLSGNVGINWAMPLFAGELELGSDFYYNSGFFYLAQNTPNVEEGAHGLLGVSASYLHEAWRLRLTAFGENITGTNYNISRFPNDFGVNDVRAPRYIWGLRLNWDW